MSIIQFTFSFVVFAASVVTSGTNDKQELKWKDHYDSAKQVAQASARPLVVVLENPTKTAEKVDETKLTSQDRQKLEKEKFELVRVDVSTDYGKRVAAAFGATKFPYTAVTDDCSKQIVFRKAGQMSETDWTLALAKSLNTSNKERAASPVIAHEGVVQPRDISWFNDFYSAETQSRQTGKPMFVYLTAPGCTYCEIMKREAFQQLQFIDEINNEFVAVQMNGREQREIAERFQVRMYPTIAIVKPNGEVVDNWNGYQSLDDFRHRLNAAKSKLQGSVVGSSLLTSDAIVR